MKVDKDFTPCPEADGDELFPNGIFVFNITKMIEWIRDTHDDVVLDKATVSDFSGKFSALDESHFESVKLDRPVILAEIAPGRYNVIDGHHRMEKARRSDLASLPAYRLKPEQHTRFLTSRKAYEAYMNYWNEKLKDLDE